MTPLQQRMIEDMQLRGFSARTQECYVAAVPPTGPTLSPEPEFNRGINPREKLFHFGENYIFNLILTATHALCNRQMFQDYDGSLSNLKRQIGFR